MSKVMFAVPPISDKRGFVPATQNRQYQIFSNPTLIYPVIPALFCSMLTSDVGTHVVWADCVAENTTEKEFYDFIKKFNPDFIVFEANTMLFSRYCDVINKIKKDHPLTKVILCGEHVTARPQEAKGKCHADYFIEGGKWYYEAFKIVKGENWIKTTAIHTDKGVVTIERKTLPKIDRNVSCWWLYAEDNGNFKLTPATYMMAAQDCWHRPACTFCSWGNYHKDYSVRSVEEYLDEVRYLIQFGFKEFFDDSGTFPAGDWLKEFCVGMIKRGYHKHIVWGCNMRFGALRPEDSKMMADAGCRFILWGFESANQRTLDLLNKGYQIKDVSPNLIASRMAGIWNHLTVMVGYPWETLEDEKRTFKMIQWLLLNDWAASVQASIFSPYPGTPSFDSLKDEVRILTEDWDKWDMTNEVVKLQYPFSEVLKLQRDYYRIAYHPMFLWNKISKIKNVDDLKFYWRIAKKVINRFGTVHEN